MPFFKTMVMETTATLFALFPCILLADTAFGLSAQVTSVAIYSMGLHICRKYSAAAAGRLAGNIMLTGVCHFEIEVSCIVSNTFEQSLSETSTSRV